MALNLVKLLSSLLACGYMNIYICGLGVVHLCEHAYGHFPGRVHGSHPVQRGPVFTPYFDTDLDGVIAIH